MWNCDGIFNELIWNSNWIGGDLLIFEEFWIISWYCEVFKYFFDGWDDEDMVYNCKGLLFLWICK